MGDKEGKYEGKKKTVGLLKTAIVEAMGRKWGEGGQVRTKKVEEEEAGQLKNRGWKQTRGERERELGGGKKREGG